VSLPTYPFERARFWVEQQQKSHGERGGPSKKPDIANWFYFPSWTRSVPQQNLQHSRLPHQKVTWLLFVDKCDLGRAIVGRLERQDQDVVTVSVGNDFARLSKSSYTINPLLSDHYDALIKELCSEGRSPNKVVHFWSVTHSDCPLEWKAFKISLSVGFNSILFLARALGEQQVTHAVEMNIISNRMHDLMEQSPFTR
jgi:acyl transferase domain-containing protein